MSQAEPEVPQRFRYLFDYLTRVPQQLDVIIKLLKSISISLTGGKGVVVKEVIKEREVTKELSLEEHEELVPIITPPIVKSNQFTGIALSPNYIVIPVVGAPVEISYVTYYDSDTLESKGEVTHSLAKDTDVFILVAEYGDIFFAPWSKNEKTPVRLFANSGMAFSRSSKWTKIYISQASEGASCRIIELRYRR